MRYARPIDMFNIGDERVMRKVTGDPVLAKTMRDAGVKAPVERIIRTDWLATAVNCDKLGGNMMNRIVELKCGHREITTNSKRAKCHACHEMILNGEDYHAFRFVEGSVLQ